METTQLDKFISKLPEDMEKLIYYDYVQPDIILMNLRDILKSNHSRNLNCVPLCYYLKNFILPNSIVVKSLINNDEIFKNIYEDHIIKGQKKFKNFSDPIKSMALSWLMYLYH